MLQADTQRQHHHPGSSSRSSANADPPASMPLHAHLLQKLEENFDLLTKLTSVMKQDPQGEEMAKK